jgi:hypothetical protein
MSMVERIAKALGLPDTGQDWGVEHADPARLLEFVEFVESLQPANDWEMEALGELILQSAEMAMEGGSMNDGLRRRIVGFLRKHGSAFPLTLGHWSKYPKDDGWRFLSLLKESGHVA